MDLDEGDTAIGTTATDEAPNRWSRRPGSGASSCLHCDEPPLHGRRLCSRHRNEDELRKREQRKASLIGRPCAVEGCGAPRYVTTSQVLPYCLEHRREAARRGDTARRRAAGAQERVRQVAPPVGPGQKWCWGCSSIKGAEDFHADPGKRDGLQGKCKDCQYADYRQRLADDPEPIRAKARKSAERQRRKTFERRYGISWENFQDLVVQQQGCCWACVRERVLVPDHCHSTGRFRAALCSGCNTSLGLVGESPAALRRLADLLEIA